VCLHVGVLLGVCVCDMVVCENVFLDAFGLLVGGCGCVCVCACMCACVCV